MSDENKLDLNRYLTQKYLEYSVTVLKDRAIPYLNDGLKPVHRRIIYAMNELRNYSHEKPKKSARIVGDVIGKYHPHGDTSVYDAMSRTAQPWNMRYPLVDGQGNFGSRDGDRQAAMRYTEARLTPIAEQLLLSELDMGTVDYKNNYDNTLKEPSNLPSKINMLLLNGTSGIAVGMATDIPAHNIRELNNATLATIRNPAITSREIMEHLKGPDFAGGGHIVSSEDEIVKAYETGRGIIRARAKWKVEHLARGQWQIVIYEYPPEMSNAKLIANIEKMSNPAIVKDKNGKPKPLTPKVLAEKNFILSVISKYRDESDKSISTRFVIEPKSSKQNPEEMMNSLMRRLELESSVKINLICVGLDGTPKNKNIKEIISEWIDYRFITMTRRTQWKLDKVQAKIHILQGRIIAFLNIDTVIDTIKNSDEPKADLMAKLGVSEIQAEDILEIRLRQLAKLEEIKIEKEIESLKKEEKSLLALLDSKSKMMNLMEKEIEEVSNTFGDERRTLIKEDKAVVNKPMDTLIDEALTVIYTKQGWITSRKGTDIDLSTVQLKTDDEILFVRDGRSVEQIAFLGSDGRGYSVKPSDIPSGKVGFVHINTLITTSGNISMVDMLFANDNKRLFVYNNDGYGYITNSSNLVSKNRAGKNFMTLPEENSIVCPPILIDENSKLISIQTTDQRILTFNIEELKDLDKGKGFQLIKLADDQKIKKLIVSSDEGFELKVKNKTQLINGDKLKEYLSKRGLRGKKIDNNVELV